MGSIVSRNLNTPTNKISPFPDNSEEPIVVKNLSKDSGKSSLLSKSDMRSDSPDSDETASKSESSTKSVVPPDRLDLVQMMKKATAKVFGNNQELKGELKPTESQTELRPQSLADFHDGNFSQDLFFSCAIDTPPCETNSTAKIDLPIEEIAESARDSNATDSTTTSEACDRLWAALLTRDAKTEEKLSEMATESRAFMQQQQNQNQSHTANNGTMSTKNNNFKNTVQRHLLPDPDFETCLEDDPNFVTCPRTNDYMTSSYSRWVQESIHAQVNGWPRKTWKQQCEEDEKKLRQDSLNKKEGWKGAFIETREEVDRRIEIRNKRYNRRSHGTDSMRSVDLDARMEAILREVPPYEEPNCFKDAAKMVGQGIYYGCYCVEKCNAGLKKKFGGEERESDKPVFDKETGERLSVFDKVKKEELLGKVAPIYSKNEKRVVAVAETLEKKIKDTTTAICDKAEGMRNSVRNSLGNCFGNKNGAIEDEECPVAPAVTKNPTFFMEQGGAAAQRPIGGRRGRPSTVQVVGSRPSLVTGNASTATGSNTATSNTAKNKAPNTVTIGGITTSIDHINARGAATQAVNGNHLSAHAQKMLEKAEIKLKAAVEPQSFLNGRI